MDDLDRMISEMIRRESSRYATACERKCIDAAILLAAADGERGVSVPRELVGVTYTHDFGRFECLIRERQ